MGETITIDNAVDTEAGGRQAALPAVAIEDAVPSGQSDADAIREAAAALARPQVAAAQQQTAHARSETARARDDAARAMQGRVADRRAALAGAVEAADAELSRARIALKTAGEAGDFDALGAAQEAIASATYRKTHAAQELTTLGDPVQGDGQQRPQQMLPPARGQTTDAPGPRSRQWIADHPRFDTDPTYKRIALSAHDQAVTLGHAVESDGYFDHINRSMVAAGLETGGAVQPNGGSQHMPNGQGNGTGGHSSSAAPSNRGGSGPQGGFKPIRTGLGLVNVAEQGGRMRISFPDPSVRENMEEGAKICYPDLWSKDPGKALADYTGEQVKIAREMEAGGNAGMLPAGEGRTYR